MDGISCALKSAIRFLFLHQLQICPHTFLLLSLLDLACFLEAHLAGVEKFPFVFGLASVLRDPCLLEGSEILARSLVVGWFRLSDGGRVLVFPLSLFSLLVDAPFGVDGGVFGDW